MKLKITEIIMKSKSKFDIRHWEFVVCDCYLVVSTLLGDLQVVHFKLEQTLCDLIIEQYISARRESLLSTAKNNT